MQPPQQQRPTGQGKSHQGATFSGAAGPPPFQTRSSSGFQTYTDPTFASTSTNGSQTPGDAAPRSTPAEVPLGIVKVQDLDLKFFTCTSKQTAYSRLQKLQA